MRCEEVQESEERLRPAATPMTRWRCTRLCSRHWVILIRCGLTWQLETEDDKIVFIASGADRVEMIMITTYMYHVLTLRDLLRTSMTLG